MRAENIMRKKTILDQRVLGAVKLTKIIKFTQKMVEKTTNFLFMDLVDFFGFFSFYFVDNLD